MNLRTKHAILEIAHKRRTGISDEKGPEYTGTAGRYQDDTADVLANFKRQGIRWGSDPLLPMAVYFGKHVDSIETFVREATKEGVSLREKRELAYRGEGILSRLDDARNYLDLMECLLVDEGILNDPRPEAYPAFVKVGSHPADTNGLVDLGPISGEDIVQAADDDDTAWAMADDYNYYRDRAFNLKVENEQLRAELRDARDAAARQAELVLEQELQDDPVFNLDRQTIEFSDDPALD